MEKKNLIGLKWVILIAALAMLLYGASSGQADAVLTKAARICMECIGLG